MEKKRNSAVEKTENIANKNENGSSKSKKTTTKKAISPDEVRESQAERQRNKKLSAKKEKQKARNKRLQKKKEQKRIALEKREEQKRLRDEKRQQKKEARIKRQQDLKNLKLQKREERLKRRDIIKNETKRERQKRIADERNKKLEIRREKMAEKRRQKEMRLEEKQKKREYKLEQKRQKREYKAQQRRERRKSSKGYGGWLAAVISLASAVLILGGLLTLTLFTPMDEYMLSSTKEQQSLYDLVGYVDAIDINLSKLVVSNDDENRQKLLGEVRVQSSLATESISTLSLQEEDKYYTTKFINQISDFTKYLSEKLIDGEKLSKEDIATLNDMYEINSSLKESLSSLVSQIDENYDFKSLYEYKDGDVIISKFKELESNAINYPHMIYDGAFSDGTTSSQAKYIENLSEISKQDAERIFKEYFADYNVKNVELVGETTGEVIQTYNLEATDENDVLISAQITKKGGKLVEFNYFKDCSSDNISLEKCREVADNFLEKLGYKALKAVWTADSGNTITINYASVYSGVICYLDLIKVNVCRERGVVSGLEASSYIYNHTDREVQKASVSLGEVKEKVSKEIDIETSRLAIVPKGENGEVLAYEFTGKSNGSTFYIYIDATTGKEIDIFKVIETTEGILLM